MNKKETIKLISAFLLGDGCIRIWKNRPNLAAYSLSQIDDHKEYVEWQKEIIENVTSVTLRHYDASLKEGINRKGFYKLESKSHSLFKVLRRRWYCNGRKTISLHDLQDFDFQSLAIWFMDDGYIIKSQNKYHNGNLFLCTDNYTECEIIMLQKIIYNNLGIAMDVRQRGKRKDGGFIYRLVARNEQANKFIEGITPFMFPSFLYKLRTESPNLKLGDEIVCSLEGSKEINRND